MIRYIAGASLPEPGFVWTDSDNALIDFSTGYTFNRLRIGIPGRAADFTKTTGITGAATSPNLRVDLSTAEETALGLLVGVRVIDIFATHDSSGQKRAMRDWFKVEDAVAASA